MFLEYAISLYLTYKYNKILSGNIDFRKNFVGFVFAKSIFILGILVIKFSTYALLNRSILFFSPQTSQLAGKNQDFSLLKECFSFLQSLPTRHSHVYFIGKFVRQEERR